MLNTKNDPMGQAIYDFHNQKPYKRLRVDSTITEDEEIEVAYLFRSFNEMPKIEQKALQLCKGKVLDVGAGAGSHALYLQQKEVDVKAIDVSELSVGVMRNRGVHHAEVADFFNLNNATFDTILLLMNGVGIAGDLFGLDKLLVKCKQLLNENGQVLLDSSDIVYMFDLEGEFSTNPGEYYGELQYQMTYDKIMGAPFNWLYIGADLLALFAAKHGFEFELIQKGDHFDYLARLTKKVIV